MKRVLLNLLYLCLITVYLAYPLSSLAYSTYVRLQSESAECEAYIGNCQSFLQECEKHYLFYPELYKGELWREISFQFSPSYFLFLLLIEPLLRFGAYLQRFYKVRRDRALERNHPGKREKFNRLLYTESFFLKGLIDSTNIQ